MELVEITIDNNLFGVNLSTNTSGPFNMLIISDTFLVFQKNKTDITNQIYKYKCRCIYFKDGIW